MNFVLDTNQMPNPLEGKTLDDLHRLVDDIDNGGSEGIPSSKGMGLIYGNPQEFLALLQTEGVTLEEFFEQHFDNHYISLALNNATLMRALGKNMLDFIRRVFLRHGQYNTYFLEKMVELGVDKAFIAELILEKLRTARPIDLNCNLHNFTEHEFVDYGAGRVRLRWDDKLVLDNLYTVTYWSMLTDEQLQEAMEIIAEKEPHLLFGRPRVNAQLGLAEKLKVRLDETVIVTLLEKAAEQVQDRHVNHLSIQVLQKLPIESQLKLARRLSEPNVEWVVGVIMSFEEADGYELADEFRELLMSGSLKAYKVWYTDYSQKETSVGQLVGNLLKQGVQQQGWRIVTLVEGEHRGYKQAKVQVDGVKYVADNRQREYGPWGSYMRPEAKDLVAFQPKAATQLGQSTQIKAACFTLISRPSAK